MFRSAEALSLVLTAVSALMLAVAVVTVRPSASDDAVYAHHMDAVDVSTGIPLDAIANPADALPTMRVENSQGERIGEVKAVKFGVDGKAKTITVATSGLFGLSTVTANLDAADLVYLRERNSLVSRLTHTELATSATARLLKARL